PKATWATAVWLDSPSNHVRANTPKTGSRPFEIKTCTLRRGIDRVFMESPHPLHHLRSRWRFRSLNARVRLEHVTPPRDSVELQYISIGPFSANFFRVTSGVNTSP